MAAIVKVPVSELEAILMVLTSAHGFSQATDLVDSYRKLNNKFQWSAMTRSLANQRDAVEQWIEEAKDDTTSTNTN